MRSESSLSVKVVYGVSYIRIKALKEEEANEWKWVQETMHTGSSRSGPPPSHQSPQWVWLSTSRPASCPCRRTFQGMGPKYVSLQASGGSRLILWP